jgi:hypothetical protein
MTGEISAFAGPLVPELLSTTQPCTSHIAGATL